LSKASHKNTRNPGKLPALPADCREAIQWFVGNFGLYQGSVRGLFLSEFSEEHEASLEGSIISLKSRGFNPLVVTGETLAKQADFMYEQASTQAAFGRPVATKLEMDLWANELVILQDVLAPENQKQLWYLYNHVLYPRVLTNRATVITTSIGYEEFVRYGSSCSDAEFGGRPISWEKLMWLIEASMLNLDLFKQMREESLPPMLKAEYYLWMSLKERGINATPQHVLGDYMLDLAIVNKDLRLDIECDGISTVGGLDRQAEEAKRNLVLLSDGWQILRFSTSEILSNHQKCAEAVEEVVRAGRKKQLVGRLLTGQTVAPVPSLPGEDDLQQAVIAHGGGPAAVTGGAGTGKTACVVQRVAHLVGQGVNPESILVLSHSPDTIKVVRTGLEIELDKQAVQRVGIFAWQELGMKILKENLTAIKRKAPLKLEPNPQKIIQRLLTKHKKDLDTLTLELASGLDEFTVATVISIYKANLIAPEEVRERAKDQVEELIAKVYEAYEDQLQRANRVDRDDMAALSVQVLLEKPDVRARYQNTWDFILVDEYQDVTSAENTLVRLLASPQDNLFLVGDEDEAVFESKGASPRFLSEVSFRMPQTRCYTLERNWRSHSEIVDHARQLLGTLGRRSTPKDMVSAFGSAPTTAIIGPHSLVDEKTEAQWVADEIQLLLDSGRNLHDIAVLYRYHRYGSLFEETLSSRGIRCVATQPAEARLVPDEGEDILGYLKLVSDPDGPRAKDAFDRVCQLRSKEVDPKLSAAIASFAEANNLSYLKAVEIYSEATADQSCKDLVSLVRVIRTMHQENLPPAETINLVRRTQRLNDYYKSVNIPPGVDYEPLRKLNQLEEEARKFTTVAEFVKHLNGVKQTGGGNATGDGIHILTLHEAKGREFPIVFMVGLAEGLFPAENAGDFEEEKRLCYVGFTRARELLYLSFPSTFNGVALQPSSFLIDSRLLAAPTPIHAPVTAPPVVEAPPVPVPSEPPPKKIIRVPAVGVTPPPEPAPAPVAPPAAAPAPAPVVPAPVPAVAPIHAPAAQAANSPALPVAPQYQQPAPPIPQPAPPVAQPAPAIPQPTPAIPQPAPVIAQPAPPVPQPQYQPPAPPAPQPQYQPPAPPAPQPQYQPPTPPVPQPQYQPPAPPIPQPTPYNSGGYPAVAGQHGQYEQVETYEDIDLIQPAPTGSLFGPGVLAQPVQPQPTVPPIPSHWTAPPPAPGQPVCPNSSIKLEAGSRFCGDCGYHLSVRIPACPLCAAPLEPTAKFCGECGSKVMPHFGQPLSPGGIPTHKGNPTQNGWMLKLLKFLEK
jgi:superfamily I DNA/RNA helicase/very-short-patch-repair endonuclease